MTIPHKGVVLSEDRVFNSPMPVLPSPEFFDPTQRPQAQRIVLLCDWLPPDFGAVGQYTQQRGFQLARAGHQVQIFGFSSAKRNTDNHTFGAGSLAIHYIYRGSYNKNSLIARAFWTLSANVYLLAAARQAIKAADEVIFTGSPPYLLHFIAPANLFWRRRLVYRITDFHPECLMAEYSKAPLWLSAIYRLTLFWRRRVSLFEAIGEDQKHRLAEIGVSEERMRLVRDPAPIAFAPDLMALAKPEPLKKVAAILYSGNFGVAHDDATFVSAYTQIFQRDPERAGFWLNAVGKKADLVEQACLSNSVRVVRTRPVPLEQLPALLKSADIHLITLRNEFVGFVLPSKVYACIDSGRPILFIGSKKSDVHLLCKNKLSPASYRQVDVGDVDGAVRALDELLPDRTQ